MNCNKKCLINIFLVLILFLGLFAKNDFTCNRQSDSCTTSFSVLGVTLDSSSIKLSDIVNLTYRKSYGISTHANYQYVFNFISRSGATVSTALSEYKYFCAPDNIVNSFMNYLYSRENDFLYQDYPYRLVSGFFLLLYLFVLILWLKEKPAPQNNKIKMAKKVNQTAKTVMVKSDNTENNSEQQELFGKIQRENSGLFVLCPNCGMKYGAEIIADSKIQIRNFEDEDITEEGQQISCLNCGQRFTVSQE